MKTFFTKRMWPVIAGLITAFAIMMVLEYINSFFFPLPENLDIRDPLAVKAFTASLPFTAYILIFLGFVLGAFKGGQVTAHISQEKTYKLSCYVGVILTLLGIFNGILIGHNIFFMIISIPMFMLFTYFGYTYVHKVRS